MRNNCWKPASPPRGNWRNANSLGCAPCRRISNWIALRLTWSGWCSIHSAGISRPENRYYLKANLDHSARHSGRHHPTACRCHRQCGEFVVAGRGRCGRSHPSRGRPRTIAGMPHAGGLLGWAVTAHPWLPAVRKVCHPYCGAGVAWRDARRGKAAGLLLSREPDSRRRTASCQHRFPLHQHGRLWLSAGTGSRGGGCGSARFLALDQFLARDNFLLLCGKRPSALSSAP